MGEDVLMGVLEVLRHAGQLSCVGAGDAVIPGVDWSIFAKATAWSSMQRDARLEGKHIGPQVIAPGCWSLLHLPAPSERSLP